MDSCGHDIFPFEQPAPPSVLREGRREGNGQFPLGMKGKLVLLVLVLNLVAAAAGAATGTVLSGAVDATMSVAVNQALQVEKPQFGGIPSDRARFSSISADGTAFGAAAKSYNGETFLIIVPVVNHGEADIVVELTIDRPVGCTPLDQVLPCSESMVISMGGSGRIVEVAGISNNKWKFTVPKGSNGASANPIDAVVIGIQILGDAVPGFRNLQGRMVPVAY